MAKEEKIEVEGEVVEALPSTMFRVDVTRRTRDDLGKDAEALPSHPGDEVKVELSTYDLSRGRITYRNR